MNKTYTDPTIYGKTAVPIYKKGSNNKAILLIHGFTGYPQETAYTANALNNAGFTVFAPRLPGHGTDKNDFINSDGSSWLQKARDSYIELASQYSNNNVGIVGHSMGGIIACILAAEFKTNKICLLAPALKLNDPRLKFTPFLSLFIKSIKIAYFPQDKAVDLDPARTRLRNEYGNDIFLKQTASLYKLSKQAVKLLPEIQSEIFVMMGKKDPTVSQDVFQLIKDKAINAKNISLHQFENGNHIFPFTEPESFDCAKLACDFFGKGL